MSNKKILIIGAAGQLGSEFARGLSQQGYEFSAPPEQDLDITNIAQINAAISRLPADVVINCAAYNAVDDAEEDREIAFRINRDAVAALAESCRSKKIMLVHYSSDYVFDGTKNDLYNEGDAVNPLGVYGKSKLGGEEAVISAAGEHLVFRLSWVFGRGRQNFLYKFLTWAGKNRILKISADEVSVPTYTTDIVAVTLKSIEKGLSGLYHLTNTGYASRYELAKYFAAAMGLSNIIVPVPISQFKTKAERPLFSAMSNAKLTSALGYSLPGWESAVDRFAAILKSENVLSFNN